MERKKLIYIIAIAIIALAVLGIIIGVAVSSSKNKDETIPDDRKKTPDEDDDDVEIVDSYNNTEELIKKFPVQNPTTVQKGLEERIQNRFNWI